MNKFLTSIGSIILACIIMAIPALTVLSFCLSWYGGIKCLFCVLVFFDIIILAGAIYDYSEYIG